MNSLKSEIKFFLQDDSIFFSEIEEVIYTKVRLTDDLIALYKALDLRNFKLILFFSISKNQPILVFDDYVLNKIFINNDFKNISEEQFIKKFYSCTKLEFLNYWDLLELSEDRDSEDEEFKEALKKGVFYSTNFKSAFNHMYSINKFNMIDYIKLITNLEEFSCNFVEEVFKIPEIESHCNQCIQLRNYIESINKKENDIFQLKLNYLEKSEYLGNPLNFFAISLSKGRPKRNSVVSPLDNQYVNGIFLNPIELYKGNIHFQVNVHELDEDIDQISFILESDDINQIIEYMVGDKEYSLDLKEYSDSCFSDNPFGRTAIEVLRLTKISETEWECNETLISCYNEFEDSLEDLIII